MSGDNLITYEDQLVLTYSYRLATRRPKRHIRPQFIAGSGSGLATGFPVFIRLRNNPTQVCASACCSGCLRRF